MRKGDACVGDGASESGDLVRLTESTTLGETAKPAGRSGIGVVETPVPAVVRGSAAGRPLTVERMGARL
jgi:hypothetical protein